MLAVAIDLTFRNLGEETGFHVVAEFLESGGISGHFGLTQCSSFAESNDSSHIQCPRPEPTLVSTAIDLR